MWCHINPVTVTEPIGRYLCIPMYLKIDQFYGECEKKAAKHMSMYDLKTCSSIMMSDANNYLKIGKCI